MRRFRAAILVAILGWLVALAIEFLGAGERLELLTLDARYRSGVGRRPPTGDVVIAWIDQESLEFAAREGMGFPWPRTLYEEVLGYLRECGVRAVGFDLLFDQISSPETDRAFGTALKERPDAALVTKLVTFRSGAASAQETARYLGRALKLDVLPANLAVDPGVVLPLAEIEVGSAQLGFANVAADADRTHRRYDLVRGFAPATDAPPAVVPSFALATVLAANPDFEIGHALRKGPRRLLNFRGSEFTFPKVKVVNIVQSMMAAADGREPLYGKAHFEGRIVLLGIHADGLEDAHPTPLSRSFPGVEIHATAIDNLLVDDWLEETGSALGFAALASALSAGVLFSIPGVLWPSIVVLALALAWIAAAMLAWGSLLVVPLALPLLAGGTTTALGFAWRLWIEGRQRRELRRAFSAYLAPEVLAEVLANPDLVALGGKSREVTLLFTDLAGFTALAEDVDARDLVAFLNDYFTRMCEPVLAQAGVIDKFLGDAIMAMFGAPLDSPDHPLRAVRAALHARDISRSIARELEAAGRPRIETRIGVHTGIAVVGNMGSNRRFDYTAVGDVVNLASRLEGANKVFGTAILVSEAVWARCGTAVIGRWVGRVGVKGRAEPIAVYEPLALAEHATAEQVQLAGDFDRAVAAFSAGDRAVASAEFARLVAKDPADRLLQVWTAMLAEPRWDGIFRLDAK